MEYWHNENVLINEYANNKTRITLYYGTKRQYSISTVKDTPTNKDKFIKDTLKYLKEEKKSVKPIHGITNNV